MHAVGLQLVILLTCVIIHINLCVILFFYFFNKSLSFSESKKPDLFSTIAHSGDGGDIVVYNWTRVEDAAGYTLFWCKGTFYECRVRTRLEVSQLVLVPSVNHHQ